MDLGGVLPTRATGLKTIKSKLKDDVAAALKHNPKGVAFVTNQELKLAERKELCALGGDLKIDLFHLYRVATILDRSQMAQIRQQYLRIGAGRPPVRVQAEVIGAARVFTSDDELFERFVAIYEKDTREESDKGWAIVKAEEEKKARAEAAKVRAEAEKARAEALQARDKNRPISLAELAQASMPSSFQNIAAGFNIQDVMPKFDFPKYEPVAATATRWRTVRGQQRTTSAAKGVERRGDRREGGKLPCQARSAVGSLQGVSRGDDMAGSQVPHPQCRGLPLERPGGTDFPRCDGAGSRVHREFRI